MIDEYWTFRFFGYTSDVLSSGSNKKVVAVCDECGKYRVLSYSGHRDLCISCKAHKHAKPGFAEFLAEHEGKHFCACGCGEVIEITYKRYVHNNHIPKYMHGHNSVGSTHPMYKSNIDEWVKFHTNKHLCKCGCGEFIEIERRYYTQTIPEYIHNHHGRGSDHYMWNGGTSFGPYCPKFNSAIKQNIRNKYNNCDFMSGLPDVICNHGRKLDVHHVDYNKRQGCDGHEWRLIPLSVSNHSKTKHRRPFWNRLFTYALQYWDEYYGGTKIPSHDQHDKYDVQVFGCPFGTYRWIHELLDTPFAAIFGKEHRKILHDPSAVEAIRQQFGDFVALVAAHHLAMDFPRTYVVQDGRLVKLKRTRRKKV